jgi:4-hydroxy-3-methylbut-2-enyl diphosphate reductase
MQVIVAKYSGFCPGVMQAESAILSQKDKTNEKIYVYGYLIHNHTYIDYLASHGISTVEDLESREHGRLLVVRTHGLDRNLEKSLRKKQEQLVFIKIMLLLPM